MRSRIGVARVVIVPLSRIGVARVVIVPLSRIGVAFNVYARIGLLSLKNNSFVGQSIGVARAGRAKCVLRLLRGFQKDEPK